ncbi:MAG: AAA ATPase central domain protein [Candidatus Woesebacteria bacterium GW2011_GWB1_39_12]|uniref:Uncharacterized AAA domain-containing protein ycf46 n=1 Tax=Candidatus Woesebacteria bacterium GW2011_GWB1_39_12 TaxID=1618574 RepID=A0A0G0M9R6_9BACT|nr:MAG: AAA ATPase central domain protein [Candidatus Woesebacteria bacterium GW2011_GWB1_39_12]
MKQEMSLREEVSLMIKSRYPLIYVVSWEGSRVRKELAEIAQESKKQSYFWDVVSGWVDANGHRVNLDAPIQEGTAKKKVSNVEVESAQRAVDGILHTASQPCEAKGRLFILTDFEEYLENGYVRGAMRKCAEKFPYDGHDTIILVSSVMKIPDAMSKDVTIVDAKMPDYRELREHFEKFVESLPEEAKVDLTEDDRETLVKAALGLTLSEAENAFAKAVVQNKRLSRDDVQLILEEKKQIVRKSGSLEYLESKVGFDAVGGMDLLRDWLKKRKHSLNEDAKEFGIPNAKGVLLLGTQGTGKSLICKTLGDLLERPVLRLDLGSLMSKWLGESENNMRKALDAASSCSPAILFLDELEKGFSGMQESGDSGTSSRVLSFFLSWMQDNEKPVFVVATCNDFRKLPPELLRKGRFDEIFFIDLPSRQEREDIFRVHLELRHRDPSEFEVEKLAQRTIGFSGAEIEQVVISGLYDAYDEKRELTSDDMINNIESSIPMSRTMSEKIQALRDWAT